MFLTDNIKMDEILTKIFYIAFQVLKVLLIKICKIRYLHQIFYFLLFFLAFTSADMIFYRFLEFHSILSESKDFRHKFSFFNGFTQTPTPTPHPLNSQNLLSVTKVFCRCSITYHGFSRLLRYDDTRKNQISRAELILQFNINPRVVAFI